MVTPVNNFINNPPPISNNPIFERIYDIKDDFQKVESYNARKVLKQEKKANLMLDISFYTVLGMAIAGVALIYIKAKSYINKKISPIGQNIKSKFHKIANFIDNHTKGIQNFVKLKMPAIRASLANVKKNIKIK